ncbi:glycosyltransferase family 4 protein [Massilia sp. TS11]|uniref:glycosyltransferase family 4 protein n=1 Tax=Massilia sp. TS11 TaxID=2908003 RepID=UPI001EDB4A76|nr:glycosyltransferase family 4 protein [Massilia sp. TS11]MCG2586861.1 glycosyltransferase family 4 protein [Massilia sp. TS11]
MRTLRILTWHTHGSYLYYLSQVPHEFYVLSKPDRPPGYGGRCGHFPWGANVHDLPAAQLADTRLDCVLYQDDHQYLHDRLALLTPEQQRLPAIYLEHDPPRDHPTDSRHPVDDPAMLLVHVTPFNALMWDNGRTPVRVVEHGVPVPPVRYQGELARGLVVVNHLARRGRRLGADLFADLRQQLPLDLIGMAADEAGGLGEVQHDALPAFMARYRFFFHPVRYTSLGLALIEAMMLGQPVVGLATTELATVIENGRSGILDTRPDYLAAGMRALLLEPGLARELGERGRTLARERFGISRFVADWCRVLAEVCP